MKLPRIGIYLLMALIASMLFAEGQQEADSGELTFWHPYGGSRIDSLQAAADAFMADNPGWTVKLEKIGWGDTMRNKWVTGLASDTLPDLFGATLDHALAMYEAGASVSAETAIDALGGESFFLKQPLETMKYDGTYIALPHYGHAKCLYYRSDWLEEIGAGVPETWDELIEVAEAMTDAPERFGFVVPFAKGETLPVDWLYVIMLSNGGSFFDQDGNVIFDTPENVKSVYQLMELAEKASPEGSIAYARRERDNFLFAGKCGMTLEPLFTTAAIQQNAPDLLDSFGVAAPPAGDEGVGWMTESLAMVLCSDSEFESKRRELIGYFYQDEYYVRFLHHAPGGMLPAVKKTQDSAEFWANDLMQQRRPDIEIAIEGFANGSPVGMSNGLNPHAGLLKGTDVMVNMFQMILSGTSVEDAVAETDAELKEMVSE